MNFLISPHFSPRLITEERKLLFHELPPQVSQFMDSLISSEPNPDNGIVNQAKSYRSYVNDFFTDEDNLVHLQALNLLRAAYQYCEAFPIIAAHQSINECRHDLYKISNKQKQGTGRSVTDIINQVDASHDIEAIRQKVEKAGLGSLLFGNQNFMHFENPFSRFQILVSYLGLELGEVLEHHSSPTKYHIEFQIKDFNKFKNFFNENLEQFTTKDSQIFKRIFFGKRMDGGIWDRIESSLENQNDLYSDLPKLEELTSNVIDMVEKLKQKSILDDSDTPLSYTWIKAFHQENTLSSYQNLHRIKNNMSDISGQRFEIRMNLCTKPEPFYNEALLDYTREKLNSMPDLARTFVNSQKLLNLVQEICTEHLGRLQRDFNENFLPIYGEEIQATIDEINRIEAA